MVILRVFFPVAGPHSKYLDIVFCVIRKMHVFPAFGIIFYLNGTLQYMFFSRGRPQFKIFWHYLLCGQKNIHVFLPVGYTISKYVGSIF